MTTASLDARLGALGDQAADVAKQWAHSEFDRQMAELEPACESPIEMVFAAGLIVVGEEEGPGGGSLFWDLKIIPRDTFDKLDAPTPGCCYFTAQYVIGDYRVDFLLKFWRGVTVVVECDGHDWHERTPEQAERDKSRDRFLQAQGHLVFRFTGREIWRDPVRCAREAFAAAQEEWSRRMDRETGEER